jgi:hypothetical protein
MAGADRASSRALPRLAVISDAAVERTGAGSLLLYRLLKAYPTDSLRIVYNPAEAKATAEVQLPGVHYEPFEYRIPRFIRNRLNPFWPVTMSLWMRRYQGAVMESLRGYRPEAVVTVAHNFLWFAAAAVAEELSVPLHVFLHDDWPHVITRNASGAAWDLVRRAARLRERGVLRQAVSRFSVSPGMAEEVLTSYGVSTTVVYPSRGDDSPSPSVRVRAERSKHPVVAHTGFIHLAGNAALLRDVARIVGDRGGHLDLYTTHSDAELSFHGLVPPVVRKIGFFPAAEMAERVAASADAVFLTASFDAKDRADASTLFPSQLADYTGIGLPVIIWGPDYSSAARWASDNPGAALLFTDRDPAPVRRALLHLFEDRAQAVTLAKGAVDAGKRYFELAVAQEQLMSALASPGQGR